MTKLFKTKKYTAVSNEIIMNPNISMKAKAVYCYLQSRPDNWDFYTSEIVKNFKEGRDCILSAIRELEDAKYLIRRAKRDRGRFSNFDYYIFNSDKDYIEFKKNLDNMPGSDATKNVCLSHDNAQNPKKHSHINTLCIGNVDNNVTDIKGDEIKNVCLMCNNMQSSDKSSCVEMQLAHKTNVTIIEANKEKLENIDVSDDNLRSLNKDLCIKKQGVIAIENTQKCDKKDDDSDDMVNDVFFCNVNKTNFRDCNDIENNITKKTDVVNSDTVKTMDDFFASSKTKTNKTNYINKIKVKENEINSFSSKEFKEKILGKHNNYRCSEDSLEKFKEWWEWWGDNDDEEFEKWQKENNVSRKILEKNYNALILYCESKGVKYTNYKSALKNFIMKDLNNHWGGRNE